MEADVENVYKAGEGRGSPPNNKKPTVREPKLKSKYDDLKGNIYDSSDSKQPDIHPETIKEIAEYVERAFDHGGDIRLAVEKLELPTLE